MHPVQTCNHQANVTLWFTWETLWRLEAWCDPLNCFLVTSSWDSASPSFPIRLARPYPRWNSLLKSLLSLPCSDHTLMLLSDIYAFLPAQNKRERQRQGSTSENITAIKKRRLAFFIRVLLWVAIAVWVGVFPTGLHLLKTGTTKIWKSQFTDITAAANN